MSAELPTPENGQSKNIVTRLLNFIEWAGNKLPDPAVLFLLALVITWVLSVFMAGEFPDELPNKSSTTENLRIKQWVDKSGPTIAGSTVGLIASDMGNGSLGAFTALTAASTPQPQKIEIKNQLLPSAIVTFITSLVTNFTGFPPLGIVLVALLGVGVAEHTGFINALIKAMLGVTPNKLLTPMLLLVAIVSHSAGDTGYVLVIPLGGIIFAAAGRHPVAGIVCAFAGVSGGFSANFLPSGLDPLLQGFTQSSAQLVESDRLVNPLCNYVFMTASCILIVGVGWFLTDKVIEPKLKGTSIDGDPDDMPQMEELTPSEHRGMLAGLITFAIGVAVVAVACIWPGSPLIVQDPDGSIFKDLLLRMTSFQSPIMHSIVPLIFFLFLIPGVVHGYVSGSVKNHRDIIKGMSKSMSGMGYYLVMVFFAAQFIYAFKQSSLGILLAVRGATFLQSLGMPDPVTVVGIILLSAFVNILIGSASAKWALIGPIFVPMLMQLGISPELTQAAYRVGDSSTNIITPLMPYFPLIVVYAQRYVKSTGIGTLISLMLPYSLCFLIVWTVLLLLFWLLHLPLGLPLEVQYYP